MTIDLTYCAMKKAQHSKSITTKPLNQNKMEKSDLEFTIFYGEILLALIVFVIHIWYQEFYKKNKN